MPHALLNPSSAERWLHCTPSARLEAGEKEKPSKWAEEGTLAHKIGEIKLKGFNGDLTKNQVKKQIEKCKEHELYYPAMIDQVDEYVSFCIETYQEMDSPIMSIEQKLDISKWAKDSFGTGDCVLVNQDRIHIIDLKFGRGQVVDPVENSQLKLYALGALDAWGYILTPKEVWMTIAQVRLGAINTYKLPVDDLLKWGESIRPKADLAYQGKGKRKAGKWCKFCRLRESCRVRAKTVLQGVDPEKNPDTLSNEEINQLLHKTEALKTWAKELEEYALDLILKGETFEDWKVVEGRSSRKITDEEGLAKELIQAGYDKDKIYKPKQLQGITKLEKYIGAKKFQELSGDYVMKPEGKPTLAERSDKRPEINSAENEFKFETKKENTNE